MPTRPCQPLLLLSPSPPLGAEAGPWGRLSVHPLWLCRSLLPGAWPLEGAPCTPHPAPRQGQILASGHPSRSEALCSRFPTSTARDARAFHPNPRKNPKADPQPGTPFLPGEPRSPHPACGALPGSPLEFLLPPSLGQVKSGRFYTRFLNKETPLLGSWVAPALATPGLVSPALRRWERRCHTSSPLGDRVKVPVSPHRTAGPLSEGDI